MLEDTPTKRAHRPGHGRSERPEVAYRRDTTHVGPHHPAPANVCYDSVD